MFTGCGDGVVRAYDAKSGSLRRTYHSHEGAVNCLIVVGKKIFTGSSDSTLRVWIADDVLRSVHQSHGGRHDVGAKDTVLPHCQCAIDTLDIRHT